MTRSIPASIAASVVFLLANVLALLLILRSNRRGGPSSQRPEAPGAQPVPPPPMTTHKCLAAADILGREFEYARITASEANTERHTLVNFYLLITGVAASAVVAVVGREAALPMGAATVLLWLLCGIGWLYFLAIIRLRQAWYDSVKEMNRIKEFYYEHVLELDRDVLRSAFLWQPETLPPPGKPWTVYFYSAMVIALLNSAAYAGGGILLDLQAVQAAPWPVFGTLALCAVAFFAFHVWLYFAFLRPKGGQHAATGR